MKTVLIHDPNAQWYCDQLHDIAAYEFVPAATRAEAQNVDAEVLVALSPAIDEALIGNLPRLEWVHALSTGVDNIVAMPNLRPEVTLTASRGIHGPQMSEMAFLLMMSSIRHFPAMIANQAVGVWERWPQPLLWQKTICIVGLGSIAEDLAARCVAFGMRVTGVSDGREAAPHVAQIYPRAQLRQAAAEADFLVVLVPYTQATHHLINAEIFAAMKPTAVMINLARGGCVDDGALIEALQSKTIAAAASDVFKVEPLPADSPLWRLPNLIITPHVGGQSDIYREQALPILRRNLIAYAGGRTSKLENLVERGAAGL